jgi:hypothetical protein
VPGVPQNFAGNIRMGMRKVTIIKQDLRHLEVGTVDYIL